MQSHPEWVRGLKLSKFFALRANLSSHPEWVRGLKLVYRPVSDTSFLSHPEWVRGLKHRVIVEVYFDDGRTPSGCVD